MEEEVSVFDLPESTASEIIVKIESLAWNIRNDWTDPRSECRRIVELCKKLKDLNA